jgi:hypothetical protein
MDPGLQKNVQSAMEAAAAIAQRRGLFVNEALQFIADFLANHPDPDVRAFQFELKMGAADTAKLAVRKPLVRARSNRGQPFPGCHEAGPGELGHAAEARWTYAGFPVFESSCLISPTNLSTSGRLLRSG